MKRTEIKSLLELRDFGSEVIVKGWVRTKRGSKNVAFIALNDGSTINNVQIVVDVDDNTSDVLDRIHTGAAISVTGKLVESSGSGQSVEVHSDNIDVIGIANMNMTVVDITECDSIDKGEEGICEYKLDNDKLILKTKIH